MKITLICTMSWMGLVGALYFVAPRTLLGLFDSGGTGGNLVAVGVTMLAISAAWQLFDATCMTLSETLRAAGDTTWTMAARLVLAWAVFLPAAYVVVDVWDGGPVGAMLVVVGYIGALAGLLALRFRSGAWKRIALIEPQLV